MSHLVKKYHNTAATVTSSYSVLVGPVDVSEFDRYCLTYQNSHTAIGFLDLMVQAAQFHDGTAANTAPQWVQVNTATITQPSALGATSVVMTTAIESAFKYIRVIGRTSQTAAAGIFALTVSGHTKGR